VTRMYLEVTDDTLVSTEHGVMRLRDILNRPVETSLWAICWRHGVTRNGISFHRTHKEAKTFADRHSRICTPDGPTRLVKVSEWLADKVNAEGFVWTNLSTFEDAMTYEGVECLN
jgi:hypothetical protein